MEGDPPNETNLKGVISCTVSDIDGVPTPVFKIPEAMIKKEGRRKRMQLAVINEIAVRIYRKIRSDMGPLKGFWHMLTRGMPVYVTTQSLRALKDMLRLSNVSLLRVVRGQQLTQEQRLIINAGSKGKADDRGIEQKAYGGRIAIDEEEKGVVLRKPILGVLFKKQRRKEEQEIKRIMKEELNENGRIHLVGSYTIFVRWAVSFVLFFGKLRTTFNLSKEEK
ncbi:hypothetical protein A3J90_02620 [candidate division WOR-1 bacterium RIFOXYC2_FULL_37_10]|nr:MAG: hypothetical protein A3J90_02620 [candidate division WOR-1 bacterium RIFOXYC2_FULL_37_10]